MYGATPFGAGYYGGSSTSSIAPTEHSDVASGTAKASGTKTESWSTPNIASLLWTGSDVELVPLLTGATLDI